MGIKIVGKSPVVNWMRYKKVKEITGRLFDQGSNLYFTQAVMDFVILTGTLNITNTIETNVVKKDGIFQK